MLILQLNNKEMDWNLTCVHKKKKSEEKLYKDGECK